MKKVLIDVKIDKRYEIWIPLDELSAAVGLPVEELEQDLEDDDTQERIADWAMDTDWIPLKYLIDGMVWDMSGIQKLEVQDEEGADGTGS